MDYVSITRIIHSSLSKKFAFNKMMSFSFEPLWLYLMYMYMFVCNNTTTSLHEIYLNTFTVVAYCKKKDANEKKTIDENA
jgi:hypothetical protein